MSMRRVPDRTGAVPSPVPPGTGEGPFTFVLLGLSVAAAAAFFFAFWGRNAAGLGRHDAGLALGLSLLVPLALYASVALSLVAALASLIAWRRGRRPGLSLAALAVALLPLAFLLLVDLL